MKTSSKHKSSLPALPFKTEIDFSKVLAYYRKYTEKEYEQHPYHQVATDIVQELEKYPELLSGFSDLSLLQTHKEQIDLILDPLFPEALQTNEIKAAGMPFSFVSFKRTSRFDQIMEDAGEGFELMPPDAEKTPDMIYIHACTMILELAYGYKMNLKRPFRFEIPDKHGKMRHYRVVFNADFFSFAPTEAAPKITDEDYQQLIDSYDNIEVWKEKFPPNSYLFSGFGIMTLFDVTTDATISAIRDTLLRRGDTMIGEVQQHLREFYDIEDLQIGFSVFELDPQSSELVRVKKSLSLVLEPDIDVSGTNFFCEGVHKRVFKQAQSAAISNVEEYGKQTGKNGLYKRLKGKGLKSILLVPIKALKEHEVALLEIASPRAFELNSINEYRLKDIVPAFKTVMERASEDHENELEAIIQQHYTSIHPTVKWRFHEAAEKYHVATDHQQKNLKLDEIVFPNLNPLYGQADIKESSVARNEAIKEDLMTQLSLAADVLRKASKSQHLPIYDALVYRIEQYANSVDEGLRAGEELEILDFLGREIYPVFNHIRSVDKKLTKAVVAYEGRVNGELGVIYEKRKAYENSVTLLNDRLSRFLEMKQEEAQRMFPHYFEKYKTDGVEYNMYIGQSLVKNLKYEPMHLSNLRLWQLQMMLEMENVAHAARDQMEHDLQIASLILVHSNPLAIRFRMEEKQFDVDGTYNIRYEIIKKRIDKAHIKGTDERLTVPGKIAIVYSQDKDAREYLNYIAFLQSRKVIGKVENLELEDLQGVSGLKALRVEVIYQDDFSEEAAVSLDELMQAVEG